MITLSDEERAYTAELLERRYQELMHELHHTTSRRFKDGLRIELDHIEHLIVAIAPEHAWVTSGVVAGR